MRKTVDIRVPPERLSDEAFHRQALARELSVSEDDLTECTLERRSIDARRNKVSYLLRYEVAVGERLPRRPRFELALRDVSKCEHALVIGFGPAGMFAALRLIELGIRPIVLERGKAVRDRRHDIAAITKRGEVNPDSNYSFGEGGAGTFSDGKLYTRSTKRGSVERVLAIFVAHGASPDILIDAHPHIGTNKLPDLVQSIRKTIIDHGGEVRFGARVEAVRRGTSGDVEVRLAGGELLRTRAALLATGHSARDIFGMLHESGLGLEQKPFALGVRVEHPQPLIDRLQYHMPDRGELPPAAYSLVTQAEGRGVFSFCMCPGGIICPAATSSDEVVVNGWSPSKRNSRFANSGVVVAVEPSDFPDPDHPLAGIEFQQKLERRAFELGGGKQVAPAQRLTDFIAGSSSADLPECSYLPGTRSTDLAELFPQPLLRRLREAFKQFGKKRAGYLTAEAIVLAVESRTSSPVRIPRDRETFMHPQLPGLFPLGEGAGYAGGIMSAAIDGENGASAVAEFLSARSAAATGR